MQLTKLVLASNNSNKLHELQELLADLNFAITTQQEFNIPEIAETGLTFIENAILKARNAAKFSGLPAMADDSGLVVDALNGSPGIYSARYAGIAATSKDNVDKLLSELANVPLEERGARFCCTLALLKNTTDPAPIIAQGIWEGSILFKEKGSNGFGYDPIFYVPTHNCSAAELPLSEKNKISHRGQALQQLIELISRPPKPRHLPT